MILKNIKVFEKNIKVILKSPKGAMSITQGGVDQRSRER
jgi:hypothetical protein